MAHMVVHRAEKAVPIPIQALIIAVAVFLHARQEPGERLHERIVVHDGIPLVSLQPSAGIAIVLG